MAARFALVGSVFVIAQFVYWPVCATALMWATVYWFRQGLGGLAWCRRQFFPVSSHRGLVHKIAAAPQRSQRHRVQIARYR